MKFKIKSLSWLAPVLIGLPVGFSIPTMFKIYPPVIFWTWFSILAIGLLLTLNSKNEA